MAPAIDDVPELFTLDIVGTNFHLHASITYLFGLYEATFFLTQVGQYSAVIQLLQSGGLVATYYKTIDFQSPVYILNTNDHVGTMYTQIDSSINFDFEIP